MRDLQIAFEILEEAKRKLFIGNGEQHDRITTAISVLREFTVAQLNKEKANKEAMTPAPKSSAPKE
jgi:prephenate dehydrogenase